MKAHRFADIFPLLDGKDLGALSRDIAENGQRHPILIFQGQILDGRNRAAACELAGVEPKFEDFTGTEHEALRLVISLNVHRRNLTPSQMAMVMGRIATLPRGVRSDRQSKQEVEISTSSESPEKPAITLDEAVELSSVARDSIMSARKVLASGDDSLIAKVDAGEVSVSAAAKQIKAVETGGKIRRPPSIKTLEAVKALKKVWRQYKSEREVLIAHMQDMIREHIKSENEPDAN